MRESAGRTVGRAWDWALWIGMLAIVTTLLFLLRDSLGSSLGAAHIVLAYLVLVLGASARAGRTVGMTLSVLAFGCFNFFFVRPYHTLAVAAPLDWLVLGAFLATSLIAAQLLARAQREADDARRRAAEVDRLALVGAEALNAGRADEALRAIVDVIRSSLDVARCVVHVRDATGQMTLGAESGAVAVAHDAETAPARARAPGLPDAAHLLAWVAEHGRPAAVRPDGALRFADPGAPVEQAASLFDVSGAKALMLPLRVHDRVVGVLELRHDDLMTLDTPRRRLLGALSHYAALGVERMQLASEAEHADALREADRLKDALLMSVSHDLRTPLTTIKALAQSIGRDGDERAITIEEEADRLNHFVADLLDLSRLAGGALQLKPEVNAAEDLLGVALERIQGAAGTRTINVSLDTQEPLLLGRFDFSHTLRVLVNLMENALKYSPANTAIDVSARRGGEHDAYLEITVADRGAGVADVDRDRIFEPFYRPEGTPPDTGSAGLGLSIARRLSEAQGGTVYYEPREGGGSRFVMRLPGVSMHELNAP